MISIIIQGPLSSKGYDTIANVKKLIDSLSNHPLVDKIVISTWSNNIDFVGYSDKVIYIENTPPRFKDLMNRYKQFISVHNGALYIKNNTSSRYVIKIRSDQYVDPSIVDYAVLFLETSNFEKNNYLNQKNYIISSHSYNCIPLFIGDFYFAGDVDDIISYTGTYFKYNGFCHQWLPEVDVVIKYFSLSNQLKKHWGHRFFNFRNRSAISTSDYDLWLQNYTGYFSLFPKKFFDSLIWRGKNFQNDRHDYYDEWLKAKENLSEYKKSHFHDCGNRPSIVRLLKDVIIYFQRLIINYAKF